MNKTAACLHGVALSAIVAGLLTACGSASSVSGASHPASAAGIGTPVRVGKFEFTVTGIQTKKTIDNDPLSSTAQGEFYIVRMKVKNVGSKAQAFDASNQYLYADGKRIYADSSAAMYLDDARVFLQKISPGKQVTGYVAFDVPPGARPGRIELHDSAFSTGIAVNL